MDVKRRSFNVSFLNVILTHIRVREGTGVSQSFTCHDDPLWIVFMTSNL